MKATLLFVPLAVLLALSAAPLPGALGDNEIGYCENLDSGDDFITVDWAGVASAIFGILPGPGAEIGAIFGVISSISRNTDWEEYMNEVGQCIDAMISEAIEEGNLEDARKKLSQIAVYVDDILDDFGSLSPDNINAIDDIDKALEQIENLTGDIATLFSGPDGYKHEKFADVFLDALAIEGSTRMASIVAMHCQEIPQYEFESKADKYIEKIQNRLDKEFQEGNPESIMYQLENSAFYTWPDTITYDDSESYCDVKPPPGGSNICTGSYICTAVDGYRYDLTETYKGPCGYSEISGCDQGTEETMAECDALKKKFDDYAKDTYANIEGKVGEVAKLERTLQDIIEDAVANFPNPPSESVCDCVLNPTACAKAP